MSVRGLNEDVVVISEETLCDRIIYSFGLNLRRLIRKTKKTKKKRTLKTLPRGTPFWIERGVKVLFGIALLVIYC